MAAPVKAESTNPEPLPAETQPRDVLDLRAISFVPPGPEAFVDVKISPVTEIHPREIGLDDDHDGTYEGGLLFDLNEK